MKYKLIIDENVEESIVITAKEKHELVNKIEKIINMTEYNLIAYSEEEIIPIDIKCVYAFFTKDSKVYVSLKDKEYVIKERLYQIEGLLDDSFVKINQGCIVKISTILKFDSSLTGSLKVILKNGFQDYISRRELKNVKRRIGL